MEHKPKVGEWLNENYRVVGLVGELAIVELVPGPYHDVEHLRYFVRVGTNNYLKKAGEADMPLAKSMFDTQEEAEQFARERMAVEAEKEATQ